MSPFGGLSNQGAHMRHKVPAHRVTELSFSSSVTYDCPTMDIEMAAEFTTPGGRVLAIPGFYSGGGWHIRFSASESGEYTYTTRCSDTANAGLHGESGTIIVSDPPKPTGNALYDHGRVRVKPGSDYFEHDDGTPFFWLADDWWHGTSKRLDWPSGFRELLADRKAKGFSMINMAIGLACDVSAEQLPGENESGLPWGSDYSTLNSDWFDMADLRVMAIAEAGLVPGIFFCWGYWIMLLDEERIRRHVRECVARWGAYPVVYNLCGELMLAYYQTPDEKKEATVHEQQRRWLNIARYLQEIDAFSVPVSAHPFGQAGQSTVAVPDRTLIDFNMLQGGHGDVRVSQWSVQRAASVCADPDSMRPIVQGETCFEGMYNRTSPYGQRLVFWGQFLNGVRGHCYGAEGIWQMNTDEEPLGPSPHGQAWSYISWRDAMHFGGSTHIGRAKRLLEQYEWWRFEAHREWIEIPERSGGATESFAAAAGIPGHVRIVYFGQPYFRWMPPSKVLAIESGADYVARWFDPIIGLFADSPDLDFVRHYHVDPIPVEPDDNGSWIVPYPPVMQDWVLVLKHDRNER